jgi:DNA-binding CsgD family transcriptional regulator
LMGAHAIAEMRIPVFATDRHQIAWVTRASVAQPLAEGALALSEDCDPRDRLVALLAWRLCHRAPQHLERRRRSSSEALDISQQLRLPARQVEAAIMLGVDSIESGDRNGFDEALSVARWVAQGDGNPRLLAHTRAMEAGAAFAEGALDAAQRLHREAVEFATSVNLASGYSLDLALLAQYYHYSGEHPPPELIPRGDHPILTHPLALVATSCAWARLGEMNEAETLIRRGLRRLDEESSMLLVLVVAAEAVMLLGSTDLSEHLVERLAPWSQHVAVDGNAWWHGGPVAATLAELCAASGDSVAECYAADAVRTATIMGDTGTLRRMERLTSQGSAPDIAAQVSDSPSLSERQLRVLELVAAGLTNKEIARYLSYSPSTVKSEVATLFRVLGVTNRAQVIRYAAQRPLQGSSR